MKILTPRSAHLTNHEVLHHLLTLRARYTQQHVAHGPAYAMKSGNLETVMHEVTEYLSSLPSSSAILPSASNPPPPPPPLPSTNTTTPATQAPPIDPSPLLAGFMADLAALSHTHNHPAPLLGLEKVEILMLVNGRPESQAELYLMVEDVESRLSEELQAEVLGVVKKWWGGRWGEEEQEEEAGEEGAEEGEGEEEG